ncbi:MAG: hypothetical protein OXE02_03365 [Chloroflexi bacterium]|nr:hypothetical protein [Chloroflexota bacterium]
MRGPHIPVRNRVGRRRRHPPGCPQHRADPGAASRRPRRDSGATRMSRQDKLLLGGAVLVLVVVCSLMMIHSM